MSREQVPRNPTFENIHANNKVVANNIILQSKNTESCKIFGGCLIGKKLMVYNTENSNDTNSGSLIVSGNMNIHGNCYIGGTITVNNEHVLVEDDLIPAQFVWHVNNDFSMLNPIQPDTWYHLPINKVITNKPWIKVILDTLVDDKYTNIGKFKLQKGIYHIKIIYSHIGIGLNAMRLRTVKEIILNNINSYSGINSSSGSSSTIIDDYLTVNDNNNEYYVEKICSGSVNYMLGFPMVIDNYESYNGIIQITRLSND